MESKASLGAFKYCYISVAEPITIFLGQRCYIAANYINSSTNVYVAGTLSLQAGVSAFIVSSAVQSFRSAFITGHTVLTASSNLFIGGAGTALTSTKTSYIEGRGPITGLSASRSAYIRTPEPMQPTKLAYLVGGTGTEILSTKNAYISNTGSNYYNEEIYDVLIGSSAYSGKVTYPITKKINIDSLISPQTPGQSRSTLMCMISQGRPIIAAQRCYISWNPDSTKHCFVGGSYTSLSASQSCEIVAGRELSIGAFIDGVAKINVESFKRAYISSTLPTTTGSTLAMINGRDSATASKYAYITTSGELYGSRGLYISGPPVSNLTSSRLLSIAGLTYRSGSHSAFTRGLDSMLGAKNCWVGFVVQTMNGGQLSHMVAVPFITSVQNAWVGYINTAISSTKSGYIPTLEQITSLKLCYIDGV